MAARARQLLSLSRRRVRALAAAVATRRAAGATWDEIAVVLDVSADTAAHRHHT
ncbi:putative transcriptional regulator [Nonomuraea rubra]|uniref:Putative transcriptional regulator n=1 Tax=Nonomuraea rubra TaxID=46180 RepID=A0A7X0NYF2_9ACTN|nr:putative transcriptional regulator [Nonomuraea rubra]